MWGFTTPVSPVIRSFHRKFGLSSGRLVPIRDCWTKFSESCRILVDACELERTFPSFVAAMDQLSKQFSQFNRFAVTIMNSIHADGDPRVRLEQSGVWQSGQILVHHWIIFIMRLNEVVLAQTSPLFPLIVQTADSVSDWLSGVSDLFFVGTLKAVIDPVLVTSIAGQLDEVRETARVQLGADGETAATYAQKVAILIDNIETVFLGDMPRYTVKTGEIMLMKMQLKISLQELRRLANALLTFDALTGRVRQSTINLNREMAGLMKVIGLPWKLRLAEKGLCELELDEPTIELNLPMEPPPESSQAVSPRRRFRDRKRRS